MKRFKEITMGKPIIMGRKTYESIGKPLPGRKNIIISGRIKDDIQGFKVCNELEQGLKDAREFKAQQLIYAGKIITSKLGSDNQLTDNEISAEVMIIGGADIYAQTIGKAQRMHITEVDVKVEGCDAFFPEYDIDEWNVVEKEEYVDNGINCVYKQLEHKSWSQSQTPR